MGFFNTKDKIQKKIEQINFGKDEGEDLILLKKQLQIIIKQKQRTVQTELDKYMSFLKKIEVVLEESNNSPLMKFEDMEKLYIGVKQNLEKSLK